MSAHGFDPVCPRHTWLSVKNACQVEVWEHQAMAKQTDLGESAVIDTVMNKTDNHRTS